MRLRDLWTPEIVGGLVIGVGASIWIIQKTRVADRVEIVDDYLTLTAALIGVVFAALALVVALLSDDYLKYLDDVDTGVLAFLGPFMIAIGAQVTALLLAVGYRTSATLVSERSEAWFFGIATTLFVVAVLDIIALARTVLMHGAARARIRQVTDIDKGRDRKRGTGS